MDRRSFLKSIALAFTAEAVEQVIPFGRVWSFPKEIVIAKPGTVAGIVHGSYPYTDESIQKYCDERVSAAMRHFESLLWEPGLWTWRQGALISPGLSDASLRLNTIEST